MHIFRIGHVRPHTDHVDPARPRNLLSAFITPVLVQIRQNHRGSMPGQRVGKHHSQQPGTACYNSDSPGQVKETLFTFLFSQEETPRRQDPTQCRYL
jgi:hypothetical protein